MGYRPAGDPMTASNLSMSKLETSRTLIAGLEQAQAQQLAGDESRTRDLNVGNVALYQLSYSRVATRIIASVDLEISLTRSASELGVTSTSRLRHHGAGKAATLRRYHWQHGSEGDDHPLARGWRSWLQLAADHRRANRGR